METSPPAITPRGNCFAKLRNGHFNSTTNTNKTKPAYEYRFAFVRSLLIVNTISVATAVTRNKHNTRIDNIIHGNSGIPAKALPPHTQIRREQITINGVLLLLSRERYRRKPCGERGHANATGAENKTVAEILATAEMETGGRGRQVRPHAIAVDPPRDGRLGVQGVGAASRVPAAGTVVAAVGTHGPEPEAAGVP